MDKLHPFVRAFFAQSRLADTIAAFGAANDPIIQLIGRVERALRDPSVAAQTLAALQQAPVSHADAGLALILYRMWYVLAYRQGRLSEAAALYRRMKSLLPANASADLKALTLITEASVAGTAGDRPRAEQLLRDSCELKGMTPAYYHRALGNYVYILSKQGRALDAQRQLERVPPAALDDFSREMWLLNRCTNELETGRVGDAANSLRELETSGAKLGLQQGKLNYARTLYLVQRQTWPHGPAAEPGARAESLAPAWAWSTRALQEGKPELAVAWGRRAQQSLSTLNDNNFAAFAQLRAHFAAGHANAARHLWRLRNARRLAHYLDDYFAARLEWIEGRHDHAAALLARALKAAAHYQAGERIDFEFSLALDMPPAAIARLCRMAAQFSGPVVTVARRRSSVKLPAVGGTSTVIGASPAVQALRDMIRRVAPLPAPVLIAGETGTGKELVARALHDCSPRRAQPFVAVNCGAIADSLLESELFGHARGAFTGAEREHEGVFQEAGSGTLFLDEIGEISPRLQVALLRVLENGEIRRVGGGRSRKIACRLLFATNAGLDAAVEAGTFRRDLLYRLRRLTIGLLPLRDRRADIVPLALHFLHAGQPGGPQARLSPALKEELERRPWPGNVRELRNAVERMVWMNPGRDEYGVEDLQPDPVSTLHDSERPTTDAPPLDTITSEQRGGAPVDTEASWQGAAPFRRADRLRELFERHGKLSRMEIARLLNISLNTATWDLQRLCASGFIEKIKPSASPRSHYFVLKKI